MALEGGAAGRQRAHPSRVKPWRPPGIRRGASCGLRPPGPHPRVARSLGHLTPPRVPPPFPPPLSTPQELGVQILTDLQRQRETILHSRDTLQGVDVSISKARQVLASMSRRIVQNKVIMWGIILLLVGSIGLVLWAKLSR